VVVGHIDQSGGRVTSKPENKDNAVGENPDIVKTPEYQKFKEILQKVIKAPPLKRDKA
jgi:hypothetical protein